MYEKRRTRGECSGGCRLSTRMGGAGARVQARWNARRGAIYLTRSIRTHPSWTRRLFACGAHGPKSVASRTPSHVSASGLGFLNLRSPIGGAAKGKPRQTTPPPSNAVPRTRPFSVDTTSSAGGMLLERCCLIVATRVDIVPRCYTS